MNVWLVFCSSSPSGGRFAREIRGVITRANTGGGCQERKANMGGCCCERKYSVILPSFSSLLSFQDYPPWETMLDVTLSGGMLLTYYAGIVFSIRFWNDIIFIYIYCLYDGFLTVTFTSVRLPGTATQTIVKEILDLKSWLLTNKVGVGGLAKKPTC